MADKIVAEYTVKVDAALKDLDKLAKRVDKVDARRKKTQDGFKNMSSGMADSFKKVGAALGVAFGGREVLRFTTDAIKLAAASEGIERAFKRIGSPQLLKDLRAATRGTVSDLDLMKKAVQASNFKVPLQDLSKLFKFAAARARETGESVEYLVNSIVLGIGRKSPLILDNLGISAVELRTRLKGVGVEAANVADISAIVGEIATEELNKMGEQADTTADKIAQITTAFDNAKVALGVELVNQLNSFNEELKNTGELMDNPSIDGFAIAAKGINHLIEDLLTPFRALNFVVGEFGGAFTRLFKAIDDVNGREATFSDITADAERATELFRKKLDELGGDDSVITKVIHNLAYYNDLIAKLQTDQKDANITRAEVRRLEDEINEAIRQRLILLGKLREVGGDRFEEIDAIAIHEVDVQKQATDDIIADHERRDDIIAGLIIKREDAEEKARKKRQEKMIEDMNMYVAAAANITRSLSQLVSQAADEELAALDRKFDARLISEEKYDIERRKILNKQAEDEKTFALFDATINGLVAVVNAYNDGGPVLAAIVAAGVALEIAAIASKPIPQFATGVIGLQGDGTGTSDSIPAMLSKGESVMTAEETRKHRDVFNAIRGGKWEQYKFDNIIAPEIDNILNGGWGGLSQSLSLNNKFNDKNMLKGFDRNRTSARQDAQFIVNELGRIMKPRKRGGYV